MKIITLISTILVVFCNGVVLAGGDTYKDMPRRYNINDIEIIITGGGDNSYSKIHIKGSGEYTCNSNYYKEIKSCSGMLSKKDVLDLLNRLYDMQFFRLGKEYFTNYDTLVLEGDTIRARHWDINTGGQWNSVIVRLGSYEKIVISENKFPPMLRAYILDVQKLVWVEKCDK